VAVAAAKAHYRRALGHYDRGEYRAAIAALEQALTADPLGKDLVYNLGVVHEKLGEFDVAIGYFRRYRERTRSPADRAQADRVLRRLIGARENAEWAGSPSRAAPGRARPLLDSWVIVPGSVAIVAGAVGTFFGVSALQSRARADEPTGGGTSVDDLQERAERARSHALVADLGFVVALSAAAFATAMAVAPRAAKNSTRPPVAMGSFAEPWAVRF
jgi:tetratricopeptide (TPR) repeat protein